MRNLFLRLISLFTIINLLFYSVYPAAVVLAQDEYYFGDEGSVDEGSGSDESSGDGGGSDDSSGGGESSGGDQDQGSFDSYTNDTPEALNQAPQLPQEPLIEAPTGPFKAPGLSYILPPEQETPASEALLTEQQQQAAYYDDLLTSEEQDQLVSQAREEYQQEIAQEPVVDDQSQNEALSAYSQSAADIADREDQEWARERGLPDADAQSIIHAVVSTLEKGQNVSDDWWQDYGSKLGDLADGAVDLITSQVREAQERGEQKKAEEAVAEVERRAGQDEKEYTEGLTQWSNTTHEERGQQLRDTYPEGTIPANIPNDKVEDYLYHQVAQASPLSGFNFIPPTFPSDEFSIELTASQPAGAVTVGETRTGEAYVEWFNSLSPEEQQKVLKEDITPDDVNKVFASLATFGVSDLFNKQQELMAAIEKAEALREKAGLDRTMTTGEMRIALFYSEEFLSGLSTELQEKIRSEREYALALLEEKNIAREAIQDVQLWGALTLAGGPIMEGGLNLASSPIRAILSKVGAKSEPVFVWLGKQLEKTELGAFLPSPVNSVKVQTEAGLREFTTEGLRGVSKEEIQGIWQDLISKASTPEDFSKLRELAQVTVNSQGLRINQLDRVIGRDTAVEYLDRIAQQFPANPPAGFMQQVEKRAHDWEQKLAERYGIEADLLADLEGQVRYIGGEGLSLSPTSSIVQAFELGGKVYFPIKGGFHPANLASNPEIRFLHEVMHTRQEKYIDLVAPSPAMRRFVEGLPEWAIQELAPTSRHSITRAVFNPAYNEFKGGINTVAKRLDSAGFEGKKMMMEAAVTGNPEPIFNAIGKDTVTDILGKLPSDGVIVTRHMAKAGIVEAGVMTAGYTVKSTVDSILGTDDNKIEEQPDNEPESFSWPKTVFAQEYQPDVRFNQTDDIKKVLAFATAKDFLGQKRKITANDLEDVINSTVDLLSPIALDTEKGLILMTGENGGVDVDLNPDTYKLDIVPIPGLDISIPRLIKATPGTMTIPITIKEGTGQVNYLGGVYNSPNNWINVYAQEDEVTPATVIFQAVKDKSNEPILVAGLTMVLSKVNQEKTISMLSGWNLITLTALPTTPLTAASLLGQIAKQGGYATTVSKLENGAWKSYVIRGDNSFSGEDFPIEPGEAYFVKNLKRALLTFEGQEFATPVKVNLTGGWNAVGFPKTAGDYTVSTLIDELNTQEAGADAAARWESGLWDSFVKKEEQYGENFAIEPNRGYIVRLKKGVELTP